MDDSCNSSDPVVARSCERLHCRRIHTPAACVGAGHLLDGGHAAQFKVTEFEIKFRDDNLKKGNAIETGWHPLLRLEL